MNDAAIDENDHLLGPRDAAVTILEYGDYECPHTACAHAVLKDLRARLGDKMCLAYRHLPLSDRHAMAELAAEAAEAAGAQGKFWEMHETLFDNQPALSPQALPVFAESIDLDIDRFADEMLARHYRPRVQGDAVRAHRAGATATPSFWINGERYLGDSDEASLTQAITQALALAER
jgi:protein-disulfide isomerase